MKEQTNVRLAERVMLEWLADLEHRVAALESQVGAVRVAATPLRSELADLVEALVDASTTLCSGGNAAGDATGTER